MSEENPEEVNFIQRLNSENQENGRKRNEMGKDEEKKLKKAPSMTQGITELFQELRKNIKI